ncbi:histidine kinase [Streptomyces palmae]|uniref:Histidine kinase n=1 Tax=Streptomyces palmae TaxID=1701085 RepID=A0A4Z0H5F9_9ACTN|nr:histidine kinase [Streptomyces palmae]TGB06342.1 histidine kinase [Streptomyces palmae]
MQGIPLPDEAGRKASPTGNDLAPRMAVVITSVVLLGYFSVAITYVFGAQPSGRSVDAALLTLALLPALVALLALQLAHSFPGLAPRLSGVRPWTLGLQALLTFLPFAIFKQAWLGMPGFLAGSALLVLRAPLSWLAFGSIMACTDVLLFQVGFGWGQVAYTTISTALTGLVVFGLSRLTGLVAEVYRSRAELAQLAVAQERLRFARDVHDLLGYSLSTITLKCELVHRLVPDEESRAQRELTEILETSRQALADVRSVARGYRRMSLSAEVRTARSMLAAVGIRTTIRLEYGELPEGADTVLASVLREGLTNVLRHSQAEHCAIEALRTGRTVRLTVANDGVGRASTLLRADTAGETHGGSGLGNLAVRVSQLGGRLRAGIRPEDGWFELTAELEPKAMAAAGSGRERSAAEAVRPEEEPGAVEGPPEAASPGDVQEPKETSASGEPGESRAPQGRAGIRERGESEGPDGPEGVVEFTEFAGPRCAAADRAAPRTRKAVGEAERGAAVTASRPPGRSGWRPPGCAR